MILVMVPSKALVSSETVLSGSDGTVSLFDFISARAARALSEGDAEIRRADKAGQFGRLVLVVEVTVRDGNAKSSSGSCHFESRTYFDGGPT